MSTRLADQTTPEPFPDKFRLGLSGASLLVILVKPVSALLARRRLRRAEADLLALDDRMLKDIGISRGEIGSVVTDDARHRIRSLRLRSHR